MEFGFRVESCHFHMLVIFYAAETFSHEYHLLIFKVVYLCCLQCISFLAPKPEVLILPHTPYHADLPTPTQREMGDYYLVGSGKVAKIPIHQFTTNLGF